MDLDFMEVTASSTPVFIFEGDPIAPVPVPASLPLVVSALSVLGLLGWRQYKAAA